MSGRHGRSGTIEVAHDLEIEPDYMRSVIERLAAIGSSPLGFRVTGTAEDREAAELIAAELRDVGLDDVAIEEVEVDGWRFESAWLEVVGGMRCEASSFGGVPATPLEGVEGDLVDVGGARRRELDRLDLGGRIALVQWHGSPVGVAEIGLELGLRGVVGMVVSCRAGGTWFQAERALGAFGSCWHAGAPPMIYVRREDAARLRAASRAAPARARMTLRVESSPGSLGCNTAGYLPGERPGPIIVGAHHDAWFRGAFDNASGAAAMLAIARALVRAGHRPAHTICFGSQTGEEHGRLDTDFDGHVGAWRQVTTTHPEWGEEAPFQLCLDASGHPELPLQLHAPEELASWTRGLCRVGEREGWLAGGWKLDRTATGTDDLALVLAGIPGIAAYNWGKTFARTRYHTPHDTPAMLDFDRLVSLTRFYAWIVLEADRDPDRILDHRARERSILKSVEKLGGGSDGLGDAVTALKAAAREHGKRSGRGAFTRVGRHLHAIGSNGSVAYPHDPPAADAALLERALKALRAGERGRALRLLARVSGHALVPYLSERAFAIRIERLSTPAPGSWGERCEQTRSPNLWRAVAALRGEPDAPHAGEWIERALEGELERLRDEMRRRLGEMEHALSDPEAAPALA